MLFDDKLSDIIRTLEMDGVLLHPSDTVWSLSCSLKSKIAIDKIYLMTNKDRNTSLTILVDSLTMLKKFIPHIHPRIDTLLHFHHKPLTVIYPNAELIPTYARNANKSVPIRIIYDPYCNQIIKLLGCPLVTASANDNSTPYPKKLSDVARNIISEVDYVSKQSGDNIISTHPSVLIKYDYEGDIHFLQY